MASNYRILSPLSKELQNLDVLYRLNPVSKHTFDFSKIRNASYYDYWASFYRENWYDFQMKDFSLLSFNNNASGEETFIYMGCPVKCDCTEEYYYSNECLSSSGLEYEEYLLSRPQNENVPYLRYDNAINQYKMGLHPANHFHFGYNQCNRVGGLYYFDINSFVAIVLRQFYPHKWKEVLCKNQQYPILFKCKNNIKKLEVDRFYQNLDKEQDFYLQ